MAAASAASNPAAAFSTASTEAATVLGWHPAPKRVPGTPGKAASTMAKARASAPYPPMLRSS